MTVLVLQWYCAFACLLCQSPCSPSLQVHSYISKHQYGFPISLGFPFFHIFPNASFFKRYVFFFWTGRGGGGYLCHIVPRIAFSQGFYYFRGRKITENHGNQPPLKITEITENHGKSRKRKLKFLLFAIVVPGRHGKSRKITETEIKVPVVCYCCSWLLSVRV